MDISHRDKAALSDFDRLAEASGTLLPIFRTVLDAAFGDAARAPLAEANLGLPTLGRMPQAARRRRPGLYGADVTYRCGRR